MTQGGDDLDDDYAPDDLVASEDEHEETQDFYLSGSDTSTFRDEASDQVNGVATGNNNEDSIKKERKRKRKEKERERKRRRLMATREVTETKSSAVGDPDALAEYLAGMQAKSFPKMSQIELSDIQIPASAIAETTAWTSSRALDQLVEFVSNVLPTLRTRLGQRSKSNGSPTLIFIAGAALRVADVTRVLKDTRLRGDKGGDVAKLFAKHFKLSEHISYLKRTKIGSAVGTPARLGRLLESEDTLSISALTHIILDITFQDAKKRTLLDIPETRDEVFKNILGSPKVSKAIKEGKVQIVLF